MFEIHLQLRIYLFLTNDLLWKKVFSIFRCLIIFFLVKLKTFSVGRKNLSFKLCKMFLFIYFLKEFVVNDFSSLSFSFAHELSHAVHSQLPVAATRGR